MRYKKRGKHKGFDGVCRFGLMPPCSGRGECFSIPTCPLSWEIYTFVDKRLKYPINRGFMQIMQRQALFALRVVAVCLPFSNPAILSGFAKIIHQQRTRHAVSLRAGTFLPMDMIKGWTHSPPPQPSPDGGGRSPALGTVLTFPSILVTMFYGLPLGGLPPEVRLSGLGFAGLLGRLSVIRQRWYSP